MKLDVLNISGAKTGRTVELPSEVFGVEPNEHVVYLAVKQYLANQRQGTHKAKERSEIARSTRKLFRQKGTGGARRGDMKSPLVHGGGRVFGPRPRDYSQKLNRKVRLLARRSALSSKAASGSILIVEDFNLASPKTKEFVSILNNLNIADKKTLVVTPDHNPNVHLSGRNLLKSSVMVAGDINTYAIMNAQTIVLSESAIAKIVETCA
jgi:large subunit ribosomal protein L4